MFDDIANKDGDDEDTDAGYIAITIAHGLSIGELKAKLSVHTLGFCTHSF